MKLKLVGVKSFSSPLIGNDPVLQNQIVEIGSPDHARRLLELKGRTMNDNVVYSFFEVVEGVSAPANTVAEGGEDLGGEQDDGTDKTQTPTQTPAPSPTPSPTPAPVAVKTPTVKPASAVQRKRAA